MSIWTKNLPEEFEQMWIRTLSFESIAEVPPCRKIFTTEEGTYTITCGWNEFIDWGEDLSYYIPCFSCHMKLWETLFNKIGLPNITDALCAKLIIGEWTPLCLFENSTKSDLRLIMSTCQMTRIRNYYVKHTH